MPARFGPAGVPPRCKGTTIDAIAFVANEGLNAFEVQFVRGVKMSEELARKVGELASRLDVKLSVHAPYWINCCAIEKRKIEIAIRNLIQSLRVANAMRATCVVFHPGYYLGRSSEEAKKACITTLRNVIDLARSEGIKVKLAPETTGKPKQFGSLSEVLDLCEELGLIPTIDFAHLHARDKGAIRGKADYEKIFDEIEQRLGSKITKKLHCHFTEVEFTEKGERKHLNLFTKNSPPFRPLAQVIVERGYEPTIICESPLLDEDALKMKRIYEELLVKKSKAVSA